MGLDMDLEKEYYIGAYYPHNGVNGTVDVATKSNGNLNIDIMDISLIITRAAYWRKANAIHRWFVDNIQDGVDECQRSYCSSEDIQKLYSLCKRILNNKELAIELLPPTPGFFFGSTDMGDWYMNNIEYTIDALKPLIDDIEAKTVNYTLYYQSSW